jgi:D-alanyl-lipoteichoic acid acyltransferase DltB (MBOAT superfamily)
VIPAERSWNRLAFLVTFFPHLTAGPIVRAANFFPQTWRAPRLARRDFEWAVLKVAGGLVKKMVFADGIAPYADAAFDHPATLGATHVWLGVYAFAFQIFFDFSGYTDIALGCAKLLGFDLPENFRRPYAATSITDFWRRWHMTLSIWLRDYLYIPLGGNRMKRRWGVYRNLMLTMLLGGLWHGAAWTFVCWGGLHGAYLCLERALGVGRRADAGPLPAWIGTARAIGIFHLVLLTWIPFRARSWAQAKQVFLALLSGGPGVDQVGGESTALLVIAGAWVWQLAGEHVDAAQTVRRYPRSSRALAYSFLAAGLLVAFTVNFWGSAQAPKTFIYFRF